ncbi:restriction system protein [Novosphingobium sp. PhB57]|uniref:restriction endonuclease n=1 Tax=Novosphingobium sp. PhB57 TaxID=2485107 RepID=UPI00105099DD|nr:restriction endonuclease [Novosphingobium sp. PhB57]TCU52336.1 restriction system protein [Novosphingobium sp. PhB57]
MRVLRLRKDDFYVPILRLLDSLGGSASIEEMEQRLVEEFAFKDADLAIVHEKSGAPIIPNKIAWSRSYLKQANLVANERRGVWVLTEQGRNALSYGEEAVRERVSSAMRVYNARRKAVAEAATLEEASPEELLSDDVGGPEQPVEWREQLLTALKKMEPSSFERLCQRLLRESGFVKVEVTGKSGDGGIDGVGVLRMNLISFQVLFQCKRYAGAVSSPTVRDFRGAMQGRADKGLIITTGNFTSDARREATRDGAPAIDLVDGELLCQLLLERRLGVVVREVRTEEVSLDETFLASI